MAGRRATRSKTGCLTCRKRKLKCDEIRPTCTKCATQRFPCDWAAEHTAIECTPVRRQTQAQPRESQHSGLSGHSHVVTIKPSLTETHLECANSVTLTAQDRRSLEYFSSSTLYSMYNFGNWGTLQYVIREVAPCSSGVMRMILALTTSEMYRKGFRTGAGAADLGLHHYNLALKNLRDGLAGEQGVGGEGEESVEAILATIFFMVHYELQFSGSAGRVKAHFEGLWAVINTHPLFRKNVADDTVLQTGAEARTDARFVLCCQLLVWLLVADVMATSAGASTSLFRRLRSSTSPFLEPCHLYRTSRIGISKVWGSKSPPSQVLFDMEIHRPVEFAHQLISMRFNIWDVKTRGKNCNDAGLTSASLLRQLLSLKEEYTDVLHVAEAHATIPWTQTMETVTRVVASYWSCTLFHRRMFSIPGAPNPFHWDAVTKVVELLSVLYKEQENRERNNGRLVWCTFMAAIEVEDPGRRRWLLERLRGTRGMGSECEWAFCTAVEICRVQGAADADADAGAGAAWVDLAGYMQAQDGYAA